MKPTEHGGVFAHHRSRSTANGRDEGPIWWTRQGLVDDPARYPIRS